MTDPDLAAAAVAELESAGVPEAEASVRFLLDAAGDAAQFRAFLARRLEREPVAYILGTQPFHALELKVGPEVLIPRPETEEWIDRVLEADEACAPLRFADIGTGSGCLAVHLARRCPRAQGWAVDLSPDALRVARGNAEAAGVSQRLTFAQGDLFAPLEGRFELIVSNPPYVASAEIDAGSPELRREPRLALDGGPDGLDVVRRIAAAAPQYLSPGGRIFIEIADGQALEACALLGAAGLEDLGYDADLAGRQRVVFGKKVE